MSQNPKELLDHLIEDHGYSHDSITSASDLMQVHWMYHEPEDTTHHHPDYDPMTTVILHDS